MKGIEVDFLIHSDELTIHKEGDHVLINVWEPEPDGSRRLTYLYNSDMKEEPIDVPRGKHHDTEKYFDIFHGGQHLMGEMGVAQPAAEGMLNSGIFGGQHEFIPQPDGSVLFDIRLSMPEEVRKREIRNELRARINELKGLLPEGPSKK